jgi:hypothetical protein
LFKFRQIYSLEAEDTISGSEPFPGEMLAPKKYNVDLPDEIYKTLVEYYKAAYDLEFFSISELAQRNTGRSDHKIVVRPKINQFGRIRIGAEIFGSANSPRYSKNSFILAKFVQENESVEIFPGQVQYYFEHEINLPGSKLTHNLAFVRWFLPAHAQKRFHCQIDDNDVKNCNIELWKKEFYEISRDNIIPIHNIYSRFIPSNFSIGSRNIVNYMAVIPINRHFQL